MTGARIRGIAVHYREDGAPDGMPVLLLNSLGTDLRLWDGVVPLLPASWRLIRVDKRGHGLTEAPPGPYAMGDLVADAAALLDHLGVTDALVVGCSIGGMIAQGLAAERPDLVRALVLTNTAAKIGTPDDWDARVATVRDSGIAAIADQVLERWFTPAFRDGPDLAPWRHMLVRQPAHGYAGCAAAIGGTDLLESTSRLRLPVLGIACDRDGSTPPDLVRETVDAVPGSQFALVRNAGHLPMVERPDEVARLIADFAEGLP